MGSHLRSAAVVCAVAISFVVTACLPPMPPSAPPRAPGQAPLRVLVLGDSFGLGVGLGVERWGTATGQLTVLNSTRIGCGFGRGGRNNGIGLNRARLPECVEHERRVVEQVDEFRPDLVLFAGGMWDVADRQLDGARTWTRIGQPAYDWYLALEFQHLTRTVQRHGARAVWTTAPTWRPRYDPALFMGRGPYAEAGAGRSDRYNVVLSSAVGGLAGSSVLDLAGFMRGQPGGEFSPSLRTDGVHLTLEGTDRVSTEFLGPWLVAIGRS